MSDFQSAVLAIFLFAVWAGTCWRLISLDAALIGIRHRLRLKHDAPVDEICEAIDRLKDVEYSAKIEVRDAQ